MASVDGLIGARRAGYSSRRRLVRRLAKPIRRVKLNQTQSPRRRRRAFDWSTAAIAALSISAALFVFWRDGAEQFLTVLDSDLMLFAAMLPKVLAGCCIGAFVTLLLPREMVARWVGHESGMAGLAIATAFGFILPGGPFTAYPVAGAFLLAGADAGTVVAFIVSWTVIGYTRALVWELPFFGSDFVLWRMVMALPLPILAGVLARIAVRAGFPVNAPDDEARKEP